MSTSTYLYALTPTDRDAADAASEIARTVARENAAAVDKEGRFPEAAIRALGAKGLLGLTVPVELGGRGLGMPAFAAVAEELAKECASTAMVYVMHVSATQALASGARNPAREATLRAIAEGKHLTTLAFSEAGSRSQFWAPVSKMEKDADGYRVTAKKSWITSANHADSYVAVSLAQPATGGEPGLTVYSVKRGAVGIKSQDAFDGLGLRGNDSAPAFFEGVRVSPDDLLSAPAQGADLVLGVVLPWFALGSSAMAHGLCQKTLELAGGHLSGNSFEHLNQALRDLPVLRARYADMLTRTNASRSLLAIALDRLAKADPAAVLYVLQMRLDALESAVQVTDLGMKACGGAAFSKYLPLERAFRDARAGWVMAPTADHLREFVGRVSLGLPLFG
ncbi:MAG TPA: acyl-CoA dehydrogenase family protein [Bdellovibrionota bacterium]|nr:acyl-CoA dehydrogenase family protein [Bdellovibrionota bacterium]